MQIYREFTPLKEADLFIILDSYNNGFDYPIHNHPEFELNLVMGNSGTRIVGDSNELYFDQDLVLLGPHLFHKWDKSIPSAKHKEMPRVITIQFQMNLFHSSFFQKSQFIKIKHLLADASRGIKFHGKTFDKAKAMMIELTTDSGFSNFITFMELLHVLSSSLETEFLASEGFTPQAISSKGSRIQVAIAYILKNFNKENIKIKEVAEQVNMSVSTFTHFFKKYTNKSYMQFLTDVRIGHACKLLLNVDQNIKQICYASGFNNMANFNRLFKKYRTCTPFEFRRRSLEKDTFDWSSQITPGQFLPIEAAVHEALQPAEYSMARVMHV